ncbi:hypothetical protein EVAR_7414_1 [Eumeta japonica]|uniref:Uncharacterized protein n=1 Tax=Eumeta variegata TaxID=151549 RepID=A0A4C1V7S8_EUMVA|nr:hypothetical protein EVAR_7414_1 [Eumeta japonica]
MDELSDKYLLQPDYQVILASSAWKLKEMVSSFFTTLKNKQSEHHHLHETAHIVEWPASSHGEALRGWAGAGAEVSPYKTIPDSYAVKEPHGGYEYREAED